mgnify:CR=1 FL=1
MSYIVENTEFASNKSVISSTLEDLGEGGHGKPARRYEICQYTAGTDRGQLIGVANKYNTCTGGYCPEKCLCQNDIQHGNFIDDQ